MWEETGQADSSRSRPGNHPFHLCQETKPATWFVVRTEGSSLTRTSNHCHIDNHGLLPSQKASHFSIHPIVFYLVETAHHVPSKCLCPMLRKYFPQQAFVRHFDLMDRFRFQVKLLRDFGVWNYFEFMNLFKIHSLFLQTMKYFCSSCILILICLCDDLIWSGRY